MRTIIAGSRSVTNFALVEQAVRESGFQITVVLSGTARGADLLGERWAAQHSIPIERYPANWDLGRVAGHIRNGEMVRNAEAAVVLWDGESPGSRDLILQATKARRKVFILRTDRI